MTNAKIVKRYNVQLKVWEVGYYVGTRFYIVKLSEDLSEAA